MRAMGLHGHRPRQVTAYHAQRAQGAVPRRPRQQALQRVQTQRAVGGGHNVCTHPVRLGVRSLRPPTCCSRRIVGWQTSTSLYTDLAQGRPTHGYLAAPARRSRPYRPDPPTRGRVRLYRAIRVRAGPLRTVMRWPRWAPRAIPMTTRWPRPSTRSTRQLIRNHKYLDSHGPWEGIDDVELATAEWGQLVGHRPASLRHRHARPDRARAGLHPTRRHRHRRRPGRRRADHHQPSPAGNRRRQIQQPPQNPGPDTMAAWAPYAMRIRLMARLRRAAMISGP